MSTEFDKSFMNGDPIDASHIHQLFKPIEDLESGASFYREASNTGNAYKVNFASDNEVSSYTPGLTVHFKAQADNTGASTLTITGPSGDLSAVDLVKKGGDPLDPGDISNGQVIAAIYTEDSGAANPRFEVLGGLSSGGLTGPVAIADGGTGATSPSDARTNLGAQAQDDALDEIATLSMAKGDIFVHNGSEVTKLSPGSNGQVLSADSAESTGVKWAAAGGGAEELNDLDDVEINTPTTGQVLRYDGTDFINVDLATTDIDGLQTAIDAKQDELTGVSDVPGLVAALNDKQDELTGVSDVPGLSADLAAKQSTSEKSQANGYAGLGSNAAVPIAQGGTAATTAAGARTSLDVPSNADLSSGLATKQNTSEKGQANGYAGLGSNAAVPLAQGGTAATTASGARTSLDVPSNSDLTSGLATKANVSHTHNASDINSGTLPITRGGTGGATAAAARTSLDVPSNSDLSSGLATKQNISEKGQASGYAGLGSNSAVPIAQGGTAATTASGARTSLDVPSNSDLTSGLATKANVTHTHVSTDITDFDQAVADALAASEWAHFPLLDNAIVSSDLSNTDIGFGIRNAGDQLDRNASGRVLVSEGLYVISFAVACEINSGGPLEVGVFDYTGGTPTEVPGSIRARYGDFSIHGTVVGDAVIAVPSSQTAELGLRTASTVVDGEILAGDGFFKIAKLSGGVAANGQVNALNDLSDVQTNSPVTGDLLGFNGSVFTNQTASNFGFVTDSRQVQTTSPLSGGGNLSSNLTISMAQASTSQDGFLSSADFSTFSEKAQADHTHSASDIDSGIFPIVRGGTGAGDATSARSSLGLEIGADIQAHGTLLDSLQGLSNSLVEGSFVSNGSGIILQKTNLSASAAPTSGDNFAAGWSNGSTWLHNGVYYLCTGDGIWTQVYPQVTSSYVGRWRTSLLSIASNAHVTWQSSNSVGTKAEVYGNGIRVLSPGIFEFTYNVHGHCISTPVGELHLSVSDSVQGIYTSDIPSRSRFYNNGIPADNFSLTGSKLVTVDPSDVNKVFYLYAAVGVVDVNINDANFWCKYLGPVS